MFRWVCSVFLFCCAWDAFGRQTFLFTSFRGNGEDGIHFALSHDGLHWEAVAGDKAVVRPEVAGTLMRDPWIGEGPDGTWHLLWTTGWSKDRSGPLTIGHATSRDLKVWSRQELIPVMAGTGARNAWAPEAVWDAPSQVWIIFWASTVPGAAPQGESSGDNGYNHRIWATTTSDWKTYSQSRLWFDPGFNCIDSTVVHDGSRYVMVFKDERKTPLKKELRLAFSPHAGGPWTVSPALFSPAWVEGPTALKIGRWWWIYFDHYAKPQAYGAVRTRDWSHFENRSTQVRFPAGQRHGTAIRIPEKLAGNWP